MAVFTAVFCPPCADRNTNTYAPDVTPRLAAILDKYGIIPEPGDTMFKMLGRLEQRYAEDAAALEKDEITPATPLPESAPKPVTFTHMQAHPCNNPPQENELLPNLRNWMRKRAKRKARKLRLKS